LTNPQQIEVMEFARNGEHCSLDVVAKRVDVLACHRSFQGNLEYYRLLSKVCPPVGKPDMKQTSEQVSGSR